MNIDTQELSEKALKKGLINEEQALAISSSSYDESDCKLWLADLFLSVDI